MNENETTQKFQSISSYLKFCITPNSDPSKHQMIQALFMMRQIVSFIFGILVGFNHLTGLPVIILFAIFTMAFAHFYAYKFLQIDEENVDTNDVYLEALGPSIAIFFITWTLAYSTTQ